MFCRHLLRFRAHPQYIRAANMSSLRPSQSRIEVPKEMKIVLTDTESQICTLFDECTRFLKDRFSIDTSCRVAGGWVRDKLLGADSNDIDIAVSDMTGLTFAEYFVSFLEEEKGLPKPSISTVKANPDQSKHLETAKIKILDMDLDIVNLRSEEYASDSRIPTQMKFGTPLQDALRRDITINALFYNVHTRGVEDLSEKGLDDLRNGVIRTPLAPRETFIDDPLRVVRCIRFASRFGYELVPELQDAARDLEIQTAMSTKISRERVGEETDKMLKGRDPLRSIQIINDLSLSSSIFQLPASILPTLTAQPTSFQISLAAATVLQCLLTSSTSLPKIHPLILSPSKTDRARLFLASALTHLREIRYTDTKKREHPAVEAAIREGLKLGNHDVDAVSALFAASELLKSPVVHEEEAVESRPERVRIGLLLRHKSVHSPTVGSPWTTSLLFSLSQEIAPYYDPIEDKLDEAKAADIIRSYNAFVDKIVQLDLPSAVDAKPLLDGHEVINALGASSPGPWTRGVLEQVVEWQLEHTAGTKEEGAAWLQGEQEAGRIVVPAGKPRGENAKRTKGEDSGNAKKAKR